jgi:hypothetical protein
MIYFFSEDECDNIVSTIEQCVWSEYNQDFKYQQIDIDYDWINSKLFNIFKQEMNLFVDDDVSSRIIKLSSNDRLPNHNFNYSNVNSLYKNTKFTIVVFLNTNFQGGEFFYKNEKLEVLKGYGVIHDRTTTQKINKILEGNCYILFSHISNIKTNKPI